MASSTVVTELKQELVRILTAILADDFTLEFIDDAIKILNAFSQFKLGKDVQNVVVPDDFKCPISGELMSDPVVLSSGQTYDRISIQKQQNDGISETVIIPNSLVRDMISKWCKKHDIELPNPASNPDDNVTIDEDRACLNSLIDKLSSFLISDLIEASKQLRELTKKNPKSRTVLGESHDSITKLLFPFSQIKPSSHPDVHENLITVIFNISIPDENKVVVAEHPSVIPILIEALKFGNMEARSNAAAALFALSAIDANKLNIGKSGALKPLIDLLEEGNQGAAKDSAAAIYNLCIAANNRAIAAREGAVQVMFRKILNGILVDELTSVIAMLANYPEAISEMLELDAASHLLRLLRGENSAHNEENFVVILYAICLNDGTTLSKIREDENANHTLAKLATSGSSRAKRKAESIMKWMEKAALLAHTT
ncbi:U-box domain-containing protein 9 [Euphorbia peplus]|nr:U-box domain-containing protein 9 [Euphorbia peplus]